MDVATATYNAVYHFRDDRLFQAFTDEIHGSQLLEQVRRNDALRSRNFPGFRISSTFRLYWAPALNRYVSISTD
jgi:hypothetical protein